jgi:hypothetical protein
MSELGVPVAHIKSGWRGETSPWEEAPETRWIHLRDRQLEAMLAICRDSPACTIDRSDLRVAAYLSDGGPVLERVLHAIPIKPGIWHVRYDAEAFDLSAPA